MNEISPRIRHEVGLELGEVDVQGAVETKRGCDGRDNLADQPVEVGVGRPLHIQTPAADVIDGLVVHHEGTVRVFQGGVGRQDGVVGLHHGRSNLQL